ncbi:MAG TPA: response regulator transcription factor [Acidimicrobiales bacterium]|nr:response regulator transcription factor [Acidimicrobiales bacterium]
MQPVRVIVVDDQEIVRAGVSSLLCKSVDIHLVGTAANGEDALDLMALLQPDVAVVDYSLPRMTGVEVCEEASERFPDTAVVILTDESNDDVVRRSIEAGARAYLYKDVEGNELNRAVHAVANGETVLDTKVAGRVARWAYRGVNRARGVRLSSQETKVLRLVAEGESTAGIAKLLCLSENTVKTYVRRLLDKLECHSRTEAAAIAAKRGLL